MSQAPLLLVPATMMPPAASTTMALKMAPGSCMSSRKPPPNDVSSEPGAPLTTTGTSPTFAPLESSAAEADPTGAVAAAETVTVVEPASAPMVPMVLVTPAGSPDSEMASGPLVPLRVTFTASPTLASGTSTTLVGLVV
jgi:hypothetical protein